MRPTQSINVSIRQGDVLYVRRGATLSALPPIVLRASVADDADFAYNVTEKTMRSHVVATWGEWRSDAVREALLAQAASGTAQVIEFNGAKAGWLVIERHTSHFQLEQLFVLPEYQNQGVGTRIVKDLIEEAFCLRLPVRLRVLAVNPAQRFYERMGFSVVEVAQERILMERLPQHIHATVTQPATDPRP